MTEKNKEMETNNPIPEGKKKFEVRMYMDKKGVLKQGIFIGGELLDWSLDVHDLMEAKKMGAKFAKSLEIDIIRHFLESVSDFLGRKILVDEFNEARKNGYI
jgi:hypothetical protein